MPRSPFRDNVVLLTGASRGIGAQLAYQLADQAACLMLAARDEQKLDEVAAACRKRGGGRVVVLSTDLVDEDQCKRLVEQTVGNYGRIDTLLYNAGRGYPQRFDVMQSLDTLRSEIALNYLGMVYCTYYALPHLKQSRGRVVGVSSFGALVGLPGPAGYNSSKHALKGFLNSLRVELLHTGVTVTSLYLGAVRTERLAETMGKNFKRIPSMSPERCAILILRAAAQRRRDVILTLEGRLLAWLYQFAPSVLDRQLSRLEELYQSPGLNDPSHS